MLSHYWKIAWRNLAGNKVFSIINIAGLSLGLSCCMLILLYIKDELSYDKFHQNHDGIYQLVCDRIEKDGQDTKSAIAAMVQGPAFQRSIPAIETFTRIKHQQVVARKNDQPIPEEISWADENFFSVFSFPLVSGNAGRVLKDIHSAVVTEQIARKYFGALNAIGKKIDLKINGEFESFIVTGVAKSAPENSSIQFGIVLPFRFLEKSNPDNGWMWFSFPTYLTVNASADIKSIVARMQEVYHREAREELTVNHEAGYDTRFIWGLVPLTKMHLNTEYEGTPGASNPVYSVMLGGIAIFILLIACVNFTNLSLAQSLKRSREIGIRKVVGGVRSQLVQQFLRESMLACLLAFVVAMFTTLFLLPVFNELDGKKLSIAYLFDVQLAFSLVVVYLIAFLAAGFYPAWVLSRMSPVDALNKGIRFSGNNPLSRVLVILQFSLSALLIICTLFINAQFNFLTQSDLGYDDKDLVSITISQGVMNKPVMELCKTAFSGVPGVEDVAYANIGKFGGKTEAGGKAFAAGYDRIDEYYLPTLRAKILSGRNFSADFPSDSTQSVLVNESFSRAAGWQNPVGKTVDFMNMPGWGDRKINIIGLVKDYHSESLKEKIKPEVFTMESQLPLGRLMVRIEPTHVVNTLADLGKTFEKLFPGEPLEYHFQDELLQKNYDAESKWKQIIAFAALVTIFISCIGLFGLSLLTTKSRMKEISIRKILGATTAQLIQLISLDFMKLVGTAFCVAVPVAWYAVSRWLQNFAYHIPLSAGLFIVAGGVVLLIAMLTVSAQAIRASLANPVHSLKK